MSSLFDFFVQPEVEESPYTVVSNAEDAVQVLGLNRNYRGNLYLDIETANSKGYGLNPRKAKVVTVQLMLNAGIPVIIQEPENLDALKFYLEKNLIVGHNIKFETKFLKHHFGINLFNVYDIMLAEQAIYGGLLGSKFNNKLGGKSLKDVVKRYCGIELSKAEQTGFKLGKKLTAAQKHYAVLDILYLPEIMQKQRKQILELQIERVVEIENRCIPATAWMELSGIHIDTEKFAEIKAQVYEQYKLSGEKLKELLAQEEKQYTVDGTAKRKDLNLASPTQLKRALNAAGFELQNVNKEARSKYKDSETFKVLSEFKEAETLIKMFITPIPDCIDSVTDRIYSDFNQYGAKSGRFTCGKPNLQQQPSRYKKWREIFTAAPGNTLLAVDYSQIELRIIGELAREPEYIEAYNQNEDIHKRTAAKMFKVGKEAVTKPMRSVAKSVNFGLNYGMGAATLKTKLKMDTGNDYTEEEAQHFADEFRDMYPEITAYLKKVSHRGLKTMRTTTQAGRLFLFSPLSSLGDQRRKEEGEIMRECKNLPIQGLCADMVKIAMGALFPILEPMGVKLVNMVHDELVFECKEGEAEKISQIVVTEMEKAGNLFLKNIPCVVEATICNYWKKD